MNAQVQVHDPDIDPIEYTLSIAPDGMSIDRYGRIVWQTDTSHASKEFHVEILVADGRGGQDTETYTIVVNPDTARPRVDLTVAPNPGKTGEEITIIVSATDNVGVTDITLVVDGQNVAVDGSGLARVTFATPGIYSVVATVSDAAGNTRSTSASVTVASDDPSAPALAITAPDKDGSAGNNDDGAIVTAPTAVTGSVTDDDLTRYTVTVHTFQGVQLSTIKDEYNNGNVIPAFTGTFGTFDPTVLKNGPYFNRLVAQDIAGHTTQLDRLVNVDGNLKLGNFSVSFVDLTVPVTGIPITVPVTGIPITVTRSYDTLRSGESGDFGYGWKLDVGNMEIAVDRTGTDHGYLTHYPAFKVGTRVVITLEDGTTEGYTFAPWEESRFFGLIKVWHPFFTADEGVNGFLAVPDVELSKFGDIFLRYSDGSISYNPADPKIGSGGESGIYHHYGLDGLKHTIDAKTGKIEKIAESHGNELTISDSGIVSNRGRELAFQRDWKNRITKITDPRGNFVSYGYDLVTGDLLSVTNRTGNTTPDPTDYTTTFSYLASPKHFLDKIVDPLGRESAALTFDTENRVSVITDAQGETVNVAYDLTDPAATKTTVTDQLGKQSSTTQDDQGNVVRLDDAEGGITTGTYDDGDRPLTETRVIGLIDDPSNGENDDLTTELTFTALGLPATQTTIVGDKDTEANGETDDLETRYTYNSAGQVTSVTDPLGNTTRYIYAFDSGFDNEEEFNPFTLADLIMTVDPVENATLYEYDEQGRLTAITTGTKFDNWTWFDSTDDTDGGTDPGLYLFFGFGTFELYVPDYDPFDPYDPDADPNDPAANPWQRAGLARTEFAYNTFGDLTQVKNADGSITDIQHDELGSTTDSFYRETIGGTTYQVSNTITYDPEAQADGTSKVRITDPGGAGETTETLWTTSTIFAALGQSISTTDDLGNVAETLYDIRGQAIQTRTQSEDQNGNTQWLVTRTVYDAAGRESVVTDQYIEGTSDPVWGTRTTYDGTGRVIKTERLKGVVVDLTGSGNQMQSVLTSLGTIVWQTTTTYDDLGRVTLSVDQFGGETRKTYNQAGRSVETRTHTRDEFGTIVWRVTRTVYDVNQRAVVRTDSFLISADGLETVLTPTITGMRTFYDLLGRTVETRRLSGLVVDLAAGETSVSTEGTVVATSTSSYDEKGRLAQTIDAAGRIQSFEYDFQGRQSATIDHAVTIDGTAVRHRTETEFDAQGRVSLQRSNIKQFADGTTDATQAQVTTFSYDEFGNQVKTTFTDGTFTQTTYDNFGRVTSEIDAMGLARNFEYDAHGRLKAVLLPQVADPNNSNVLTRPRYEYRYDAQNNQASIRDPLYGHSTVDPTLLRETTFTYDERGNQLSRTMPDGSVETFQYDDRGRQTLHVSFEGIVTEFLYDDQAGASGRVKEKRFFNSLSDYNDPLINPVETITFKFDALGREIEVTHDRGASQDVWSSEFDADGRVMRVVSPQGAVNYEYDPATGLRTRLFTGSTGTYAGDQTDPENDFRYEYDDFGRLEKVEVWERNDVAVDADTGTAGQQPEMTTYSFDLVGNLDRADLPNGVVIDYDYDFRNRLDVLTHYLPDATPNDLTDNDKLAEFDYTVRADGKRTAATETFWYDDDANGTLDPHVNQLTWNYDDAGRLTDEVFNHYDDLLDQTQNFTYDLTGNRLTRTVDKANDGSINEVFTSLYDENDRLQSEQADLDNDGTADRTTAFGYTSTQQTSKSVTDNATSIVTQSTTYQYNLQGRMSQVVIDSYDAAGIQTKGETLSYEYNPNGIRVEALEEIDSNANGTFDSRRLTEYLIESRNDTGYAQVLQETQTDADTGAEIKKIVYTLGLDHITQTTFVPGGPTDGETLVFNMDGHGSTRVLTDMAAAIASVATVQQIFHFDAHGNAIGFDPANAATNILYSGEQFDTKLGQQYLRARYYNPATGTFNRLDDFAGNFNDPQSLHKYLYANGDPINGTDPTGEFTLVGMLSVGAIIGALGGFSYGTYLGTLRYGFGLKALGYGVIGGLIGAVVGAAAGAGSYFALTSLISASGASATSSSFLSQLLVAVHPSFSYVAIAGFAVGMLFGISIPIKTMTLVSNALIGGGASKLVFEINKYLTLNWNRFSSPKVVKLLDWLKSFEITRDWRNKPVTPSSFVRSTALYSITFLAGFTLGYVTGATTRLITDEIIDLLEAAAQQNPAPNN